MAPRCSSNVTPINNIASLETFGALHHQLILASITSQLISDVTKTKKLSLLRRRLAMIGVTPSHLNTTTSTLQPSPYNNRIPNNKGTYHRRNNTSSFIYSSSLSTSAPNHYQYHQKKVQRRRPSQLRKTAGATLEASSTLGTLGTTVGPSLFISSTSGAAHVAHSPTAAAVSSHNVAASSGASAVTDATVTEFPWASGDEALFLLLLNGSGGGGGGGAALGGGNGTVVRLCSEWEPAQHGLFQAANLFFAVAFLVPRSFRQSILLLRTSLAVGFCVSALWAALTVCAADVVAWSAALSLVNAAHAVRLAVQFLPPRLSPELLELYERLFGPLKVEKQHFKEMTREGRLMQLEPGDTYAVEDVTPADDRLAVLLRGKLRVTCDQTYLHFISPQQFVDSPEWEAARSGPNHVFQVTITAEETSVCLCWSKPRLENLFRLRPLLEIIMLNLIGKDITHKLYSMNEQLLSAAGALVEHQASTAAAAAARQQAEAAQWGGGEAARATSAGSDNMMLHRSLSVDAVHTGSRGHVRSLAWRARQLRRVSLFSDRSPPAVQVAAGLTVFPLQHQASPIRKANHFPATSPFTHQFRRRPTPSWARPPPLTADTCFSYSPSTIQGSSRGPSYFSYPGVQQPLAASGLLIEHPLGVTPSPIMAAMAASMGGLLRLPPHAPNYNPSNNSAPNTNGGARKEVTFEESTV